MIWRGAWLTRRFALTPIKALAVAFLLVMVTAGVTWFTVDRSAFLRATCEAGFPNLTLLSLSDDGKFACAVFEKKQRVLGTVRFAGGMLFFDNPDFASKYYGTEAVVFRCLRDGCEKVFSQQFRTTFVDPCFDQIEPIGFAGAIVEGWVTEDTFKFGHLPRNGSHVIVVDRVTEVFDPPSSQLDEWRQGFDRGCEGQ